MFIMYFINLSLIQAMSFFPRGQCKVYNIFSFSNLCLFAQTRLTVSGSMELIKAKKFVMVGSRWRVEVGAYRAVKKVSICLDPNVGKILSMKTSLRLTFYFDAVVG